MTTPQDIFQLTGDTETSLRWMRQFPKYTKTNIDAEGVMLLQGSTYYFVRLDHPVVHFLRTTQGCVCAAPPPP